MSGNDIRPLRIIGTALITGPALFLGVVILLRSNPDGVLPERPDATVTWVSLFIGLSVVTASLLMPGPKGGDIGRIRGHFITRLALVEGGALFGTVAYLLEGRPVALGVGVACIGVMAALHFPTRERVARLQAERASPPTRG